MNVRFPAAYQGLPLQNLPSFLARCRRCRTPPTEHARGLFGQLGNPPLIDLGHAIPPVNGERAATTTEL
ncbi:hypothetical protein [Streptomyces nigrescens]|uniref:hypothetical protein n=1 Tax=Streptomyces nigrescens TaxID=1920 RepID=UPI00369793A5